MSYSLRQIVELTGLSEFTLRGWETRHQAFAPRRSATGRRRYSSQDLQRALLLRELTQKKHRIGSIAKLSAKKLSELFEENVSAAKAQDEKPDRIIISLFKRVSLQEWDELENELSAAMASDTPLAVMRAVVLPSLKELSNQVSNGFISVAQEHIFSALLKERLQVLREARSNIQNKIKILVAAPEGDMHELGILAAHVMAGLYGVRSLFVGPNTPKQELCETAHRYGATHVLLGSSISKSEGAKDDLYTYLHFLDRHLSPSVSIWLGGRLGGPVKVKLKHKTRNFMSLVDLELALQELPASN
jgi:DNA-binding transcriptional MerR regulator